LHAIYINSNAEYKDVNQNVEEEVGFCEKGNT